jgi:hypothetical protein
MMVIKSYRGKIRENNLKYIKKTLHRYWLNNLKYTLKHFTGTTW